MTAAQGHRRWQQRRKDIVEEHFPDVCTCYIFKTYVKASKSCKECQACPGCEQHIKNKKWAAHARRCRALNEAEEEARGRINETVRSTEPA